MAADRREAVRGASCYTFASLSGASLMECITCHIDDRERHLNKCPICFKWVCEECAIRSYGRMFCAKKCADAFFFGDDDE